MQDGSNEIQARHNKIKTENNKIQIRYRLNLFLLIKTFQVLTTANFNSPFASRLEWFED